MILTINGISSYNNLASHRNNIKKNSQSNVNFQGSTNTKKIIHYAGYLACAGIIASLLSCSNKKTNNALLEKNDSIEISIDSSGLNTYQTEKSDGTEIRYHYLPNDNEVNGDNYAWKETIKPDGRVEIDSMDYKIIKTPSGERIISKVENNNNGTTVIKTTYPDGSTGVRVENGKNYTDTVYWSNGNVKMIRNKEVAVERGKYPSDDKERIINQTYKVYDENGILLYWEVVDSSQQMDENNFKYDDLGRIIYDGYMKYEYEGDSEIPILITDELEGCKYIVEYEADGAIKNQYFKASNGVITSHSQIYENNW